MSQARLEFDWGHMTKLANAANGASTELAISHMVVRPGHASPVHHHPNCEEAIYLVRGRLEHQIAQVSHIQAPGSTVVIPRGAAHETRNIGDHDAEVIVSYSSATPIQKPGRPTP